MERVSVLHVLLLLLLCSLSGAELQDNEISEQRQVGPESVNVPEQPQPCPSDLHAVLRDMSAALAEHRVRIEQLHALNQEQEAKLGQQAVEMREQAAKLGELEMKTNDVDSRQQVGQVAFSASLLASGDGTTGPFNTQVPLTFRFVITNIGNAYNPDSGFFTAPVRGAYHFEIHIGAHGRSSHASSAVLVKNGGNICIAYEHQTNGFGKSSNGATLLLEAGDIVFVRLWQNTIIFDNGNHHCTFSGHLLFTM
ncbi:complement C1q-like protein 2 isoform X3 [Eucyclogobius newberryi]|uniref:complement C1q-like protein 2 isoform X3 n=1 Tax=Eucyclogobius newberryi TaxID=166745 RepID=UPI003B5AC0B0